MLAELIKYDLIGAGGRKHNLCILMHWVLDLWYYSLFETMLTCAVSCPSWRKGYVLLWSESSPWNLLSRMPRKALWETEKGNIFVLPLYKFSTFSSSSIPFSSHSWLCYLVSDSYLLCCFPCNLMQE